MAAVLAAAAGELVFRAEFVAVVADAEHEFQIGRGREDVLDEQTVGIGFMAVLRQHRLQPA